MMQILSEEWLILFAETNKNRNLPSTLICNDEIIMDNIYCILIIVQHFFIIFLVSHKFLRSIDFIQTL